jgi:hypothetical protein
MRPLHRWLAPCMVWGMLLCCPLVRSQPSFVDASQAMQHAPRIYSAQGEVPSGVKEAGDEADERLARLQGIEKILAMEVGAVDSLSRMERERKRRNQGLFANMRRMGMNFVEQLEGAESAHNYEGMRCVDTAKLFREASTTAEKEQVCSFVSDKCAPKTGFINYLAVPYCHFAWAPIIGSIVVGTPTHTHANTHTHTHTHTHANTHKEMK